MKLKKNKVISCLLAGLLLITALAGCGGKDQSTTTESTTTTEAVPQTVTITDGTGRDITLTKPLEKVVSGINIVTELLKTIGVEDRLVAIDPTTSMNGILYGDVSKLPVIQSEADNHYGLDFEAIINLAPDVVILGLIPQEGLDTVIKTLEPEIPVIALSYDTPEQIMESVALLGEIFDREEVAAEYVDFFKGTLDMITARVAGIPEEDKPAVYFEWMPYYTFNKDLTIYNNLITLPGGINAAADMATTYGTIDPEWVIQKNPDIIISMAMPYSYMGAEAVACGYEVDDYASIETYHESLSSRSELSGVTAIREGSVRVIHYELPTVSCIGYAYMAKWLHPELFEDLDPQAIHQEWLTRFMRVDYDLDEHGVFVYPEPTAEPESVTITDATGREITLKLPIERVAYLHPTVAEGLRIIDAWDKVIAIDNYTTDTVLFPGIEDMPVITYTEAGEVDYEAIIELQPDVLLVLEAASMLDMENAIATLEPEIPVISVFDTYDSETWENGIALLGTVMQHEAEAQEFISFMQEIEDTISSRTAGLSDNEKPSLFLKALGWTPEAFCSYSNEFAFVGKAMEMIGAVNIAADLPSTGGWIQEVDPEWLMTQEIDYIFAQVWDAFNPDAIGFLIKDESVIAGLREETMSMTAIEDSKAVTDGNVYMLEATTLTTLRYVVLLQYMAKTIHPELFADIDPMDTLQEYLTRFIRIDHDLDNSGVFFYPES